MIEDSREKKNSRGKEKKRNIDETKTQTTEATKEVRTMKRNIGWRRRKRNRWKFTRESDIIEKKKTL